MDSPDTIRGGERHALTVELGDTRVLDVEGDKVRLWTAAGDEGVALFVPPGVEPRPDLRTGGTYRFDGVWGCTRVPPVAGGAVTDRRGIEAGCPVRGGELRGGVAVDALPAVRPEVTRHV